MYIANILIKFWHGKLALWKSYWLIGELLNSIIILLIYNVELKIYKNNILFQQLPFLDFSNFHFLNKIFLFAWTFFITVGIWRAAEYYQGKLIWIILTLIVLSYRIFTLRIIFF